MSGRSMKVRLSHHSSGLVAFLEDNYNDPTFPFAKFGGQTHVWKQEIN